MTIGWLTPDWPAPPVVRSLSTLRVGGVSGAAYASLNLGAHVGDAADAVAENRRRLRSAAGLPSEPVWLSQVHGHDVADLDGTAWQDGARIVADGAVTRRAGRVCAILTADCLPVLFAAADGSVVGAAHAGWRGLAGGVLEATVRSMRATTRPLESPPPSILAWLGPAIGPRHFEVGAEVRDALLCDDSHAGGAFERNARGRFLADLYTLARRRLERLGIARIHGGGECTYARPDRYFSHRRDGPSGRQATLIWLEDVPTR